MDVVSYLVFGIAVCAAVLNAQTSDQKATFTPQIPKVWTDKAMSSFELPRAVPVKIEQMPSSAYYQIPERIIWKTYPVYAPGREPKGYWEWLQKQEPEKAVHWESLRSREDWIKAGSLVFESANTYSDPFKGFVPVRAHGWFEELHIRTTPNGVLPYYRYVIREKGKVEVTQDSCASCHTRVMPDGKVIPGAQGNVPFGKLSAFFLDTLDPNKPDKPLSDDFFAAPWIKPDPTLPLSSRTIGEFAAHNRTIPEGVNLRQGTSDMYPIQIPDIIGVGHRHYLDRTGLQPHHGITDLMRYAAVQNFVDEVTRYDGFIPANRLGDHKFPEPATLTRDSDRSLYALAMYVYSLQPPPNPNRFGPLEAKGQRVFKREGCPACHTPPLYTNNKLIPVEGFKVSNELRAKYEVMSSTIDTDPFNALCTRRGTGFYKVPSLKGVWYRGPFEHNGEVATLEEWFDSRRLEDSYVPTGYQGYGAKKHAVPGHLYGLDLSPADKKALIAFLKTL